MKIQSIAILLLFALLNGCSTSTSSDIRAGLTDVQLEATDSLSNSIVERGGIGLTGTVEGFEKAVAPREISLPQDFGPHKSFKLEWWYFTGNLQDESGRRFGYQFTIFRQGIVPPKPADPATPSSAWRAVDAYLGHFAITDVESNGYRHVYRVERGADIGLAGAQADPFRVWVADWSMAGSANQMLLKASDDEQKIGIDFQLTPTKPMVLQGDQGLSQKSATPGDASYYFSFPRIDTKGTVSIDGKTFTVTGLSWMDREWSTSQMFDLIGWDWFSLQFENGYDLMWYQLRTQDGRIEPRSSGSLVDPDGKVTYLKFGDLQLDVLDQWTSPVGAVLYPSAWRIRIPSQQIDITFRPFVADQEIKTGHRYWEGAVQIEGTMNGQAVKGTGYVELTGYATEAFKGMQ